MSGAVRFEFHVSRAARDRYGFPDELFSLSGNVILANLAAVRKLARAIDERRQDEGRPRPLVQPGELNAMGLIDEVLHFVTAKYQRERDPRSMTLALEALDGSMGRETLDRTLCSFCETFPPVDVYRGRVSAEGWLAQSTAGVSHRAIALEELLLLSLANDNPAFASFRELFDDRELPDRDGYLAVVDQLGRWFTDRPPYGPFDQPLVDMLRSPALASPTSLTEQLDYIRRNWGYLLGELLLKLLTGLDVLGEEERARWMRFHPAGWDRGDSGRGSVIRFDGGLDEPERFSHDRDWMPRVVLMAKTAHVWLDQLSRRHGRAIVRLDQIPDEELDRLARWGFTGLWLIGVWERSRASQRIKQLCGNPDAAASAYSLHDYSIAADLGGEEALNDLRRRAWSRGIRLASDMVPNHMGIDSRWVVERPDWFLSLPEPPFPSYSFNGPDLSWDERVGIQIDDHYYDRSDAAVVFRRADRWTGDQRFIYHGNDGTSTPWNDTAQLDYRRADVRGAVIETILHVARQFPIIRFDAAMTLAKRHYQRLWFPEPGTGGAIPSRAEHGLTREQFDALMPQEFWREVVDRAAAEAPDTLLLAEAFWLMEGYFVRTLGMHRVYNSAFMNMLRDEQNANYRSVMKNTLEFDPEVLKRYVNFMNNPDERTAVDQFGRGDKYFGVCTLMITLPGLPMFGHGQVEGFEERYGMEFRRAYRDEPVDQDLVDRHEREIFPLLHRRALFADISDFLLYDFFSPEGHVNEDVFAYSNRRGDERAVVVYHNRYAGASGWIRTSVAYADKANGRRLTHKTLGDGLGLPSLDGSFCRFRDLHSGLEYLRSSRELHDKGLFVELGAYRCMVFLDIREVRESAREPWAELARQLGGGGVSSLDDALHELVCRPIAEPFRALLHADRLRALASVDASGSPAKLLDELEADAATFLEAARREGLDRGNVASLARRVRSEIEGVLARWAERRSDGATDGGGSAVSDSKKGTAAQGAAPAVEPGRRKRSKAGARAAGRPTPVSSPAATRSAEPAMDSTTPSSPLRSPRTWGILLAWSAVRAFDHMVRGAGVRFDDERALEAAREWRLNRTLTATFEAIGLDDGGARQSRDTVLAMLRHFEAFEDAARHGSPPHRLLVDWFSDDNVRRVLGVNVFEDVEYLRQESFEDFVTMLELAASFTEVTSWAEQLREAGRVAGFRVDLLVDAARARS